MATTDAKASCLYPNSDRATREAVKRGFDAAVMRDPWDNIAEFAFANIFIARNGRVLTPAANGTSCAMPWWRPRSPWGWCCWWWRWRL